MTQSVYRENVIFRVVAAFLASCMLFSTVGISTALAASQIIPSGTIVITTMDEDVSTKTKNVGDAVRMSVAADVVVSGVVVIKAGAPVEAVVKHVKKPGAVGAPGEIAVEVRAVQAVDGKMIRVIPNAAEGEGENKQTSSLVVTLLCCVLGLLMKGGEATIKAGTTVSTSTAQEMMIEM